MWLGDEMRLLYAALLNAAVWAGAYLFARRWSPPGLQRPADTLLLGFGVQYGAVMIPGLLHLLCPTSMSVAAVVAAGALGWIGWRGTRRDPGKPAISVAAIPDDGNTTAERVGGFFVVACLVTWIGFWAYVPITATDPLTYHVPAAVQWLRDGRISLLPTWFFNPANTFSPLAGSAFIAWWLAPMRGDVLARFAQAPALVMIFAAIVRIARAVGVRPWTAVITGAAAALSRPLLNEAMLPKDDICMTAFFACAVAACVPGDSADRRAAQSRPWRFGLAVGLMLATKYTALLSLPILLLLAGRWVVTRDWRSVAVAGLVVLLAGPWYLRNWIATGNPVFPVDVSVGGRLLWRGLFTIQPSDTLRHATAAWNVFTHGYFAIPVPLTIVLLLGWIGAIIAAGRRIGTSPMVRICLLGPLLGVSLFLLKSPYPEVRFVFPSLVLVFVTAAIGADALGAAFGAVRAGWVSGGAAVALLGMSLATTHVAGEHVAMMAAAGLLATGGGVAVVSWWRRVHHRHPERAARVLGICGIVVALGLAGIVYVYGRGFMIEYRSYTTPEENGSPTMWDQMYDEGAGWSFVRRSVPPGSRIAYANTHLIYPLLGADLSNRVFYVPPRSDVTQFSRLPHLSKPVSGERMVAAVTELLDTEPDVAGWVGRIMDTRPDYLFVVKATGLTPPPEIELARQAPHQFVTVFEDSHVVVYRVVAPH